MKDRFRSLLAGQTAMSVAYLLFGLLLLFRPGLSGALICAILGVGTLALGAARLFRYWKFRETAGLFQADLWLGVLFAAAGIFIMARPDVILSILPIVLGLVLLLGGLSKVQQGFQLKGLAYSRWPSVLAAGILTCLFGVVLLVNPFRAASAMLQCVGIGLLVDGASELWAVFCLSKA